MTDRELERLLRMALEVEQLAGDSPVVVRGAGRRARTAMWLGLSSLAAAAAVVFVSWPRTTSPTAITPAPISLTPEAPASPAIELRDVPLVRITKADEPDDAEQSVVFGIFRGPEGECSCVQLTETDWGDRRLADVGRNELLAAVLGDPCTTMARQLLVVAVSGKPGSVPNSRADAETLALRLAHVPINEHQDVSLAAYAAMPQLPAGSTVVAEAVSFIRR
jgi:hypothetical protein